MPQSVKDFTLPANAIMKKFEGRNPRRWPLLVFYAIFLWPPLLFATPQQLVIVVDPGHGGNDSGSSCSGDYNEKQFTLSLAQKIAEKTGEKYRVILTRTTDILLSPEDRAALANHLNADLMVSVHAATAPYCGDRNAFLYYHDEDSVSFPPQMQAPSMKIDPNGETVYWQRLQARHLNQSQAMANAIKQSLLQTGAFDHVMVAGLPLVTLMGADLPAVMVEVGCLHPRAAPSSRILNRQLDIYSQSIATAIDTALSEVARSTQKKGP